MRLFNRKKGRSLSELQSVPDGTFRCDVCRFVQPLVCLCGGVADGLDKPPKSYTLCGVCAMWLGFGETRFPGGLLFNLSEKERTKIRILHEELDMVGRNSALLPTSSATADGLENVPKTLERLPNLRELVRLRSSLLRSTILSLSDRLTRGEPVDASEIEKANS